jgi:hypothetical protein
VDYDTVQANLKKQQAEANANNSNIGAEILRRFNQGQGVPETQKVNGNNANPNTISKQQPQTNQ